MPATGLPMAVLEASQAGYGAASPPVAEVGEGGEGFSEQPADAACTEEDGDIPELLELVDAAEEAAGSAEELAAVLKNIGRRIRATPGDRDLLSDFDGTTQICQALAGEAHNWQGEAMLEFCRIMPDVCRTSLVNRATLRDGGFVSAAVELLRSSLEAEAADEASATAASSAICATCTASDGNKKAAAQLFLPEEASKAEEKEDAEASDVPIVKPGALCLLLDALEKFPSSARLQTEAVAAFRSLIVDDDTRKAECTPAAVENREVVLTEEVYLRVKEAVKRALECAKTGEASQVRLQEQALLLLRELARGPERIQDLAKPSTKLMPFVRAGLESEDARLVRSAMSVLRAFAFCEDVRDELSLSCETKGYIRALRRHISTPVVCEQTFGLIGNLTMRNPAMASFLNDGNHEVVSLGQLVLSTHPDRPDVAKSVVQLLWSVARQNEKALAEARELELFPLLRKIAGEHKEEKRWHGAVDATMQFLREFREDEGLQRKAVYNAFY